MTMIRRQEDAISAAVRQVTTVIPRGWFIKTDGYG
jgi:hypothetical protein